MQFGRFDDLRNPAVVIGFSGWNDAGNAASDLLRHLMEAYPGTDLGVIDDERAGERGRRDQQREPARRVEARRRPHCLRLPTLAVACAGAPGRAPARTRVLTA